MAQVVHTTSQAHDGRVALGHSPRHSILRGIWPAVLIETGANGRIDLACLERATAFYAQAAVHGVYTADTASEFYCLEFDEWNDLATEFRRVTQAFQIPAGIGCTWTNQAGVLRRLARARELKFNCVHLSQPYWLLLNDEAQQVFWSAVGNEGGPQLPIIVYSGGQAQFPIDGPAIQRLRQYCPTIAGTKTPGFDAVATNSLLCACDDLVHLVHETVLAPSVALGAAGCPSALASISPAFMVRWFALLDSGNWAEAFEIQRRVNRFYDEAIVPLRARGYIVDKALAQLGGYPAMSRHPRPPYAAVPEESFRLLRAKAQLYLPDCFV